jgi:hypothetical protein
MTDPCPNRRSSAAEHVYSLEGGTVCCWCGDRSAERKQAERDSALPLPRNPRAEFDAYEQGYRDAIADVVAWLLTDGRDEMGDDAADRIKRGDANGARRG